MYFVSVLLLLISQPFTFILRLKQSWGHWACNAGAAIVLNILCMVMLVYAEQVIVPIHGYSETIVPMHGYTGLCRVNGELVVVLFRH